MLSGIPVFLNFPTIPSVPVNYVNCFKRSVCPVHRCKRSVCLFNRILQSEYDQLKQAQYEQQTKSPYDNVIDEIQRNGELSSESRDAEMIAEAKLLRQHKGRLEARMQILEDHNNQLDAQLRRLRQLLAEQVGMSGYEQVDMLVYEQVDMWVYEQVDMSVHEQVDMLVYSSNVIFRIFEYLLTS